MTTTKIKEQLCYYDKRHPNYTKSDKKIYKDNNCYCDNCFRGKHELANELLRVKEDYKILEKKYNEKNL